MSNINTMSQTTTGYESYNLSIALYETAMRKETDGKTTYHARPVIRKTVDMESVANDMITTSAITGYTVEQILEIWNVVNSAILDRVLNGAIVQSGIGSFYPRVIGSFTGKTDSYDPERHSIDIGFRISSDVKDLVSEMRPSITQGNTIIPEIESVVDFSTGKNDELTPGGFVTITGRNIAVSGTDDSVGILFENIDDGSKNVKIASSDIGLNTSTKLAFIVPVLEVGNYRITLTTQCSRSGWVCKDVRSFTVENDFIVKA